MILVTGATGRIGSALARILADQNVPARALVRSPEKGRGLSGQIEPVVGDLADPGTLGPALDGVDALFLLTPFAPGQVALATGAADAAARAGIGHVVRLSAQGADPGSPLAVGREHGEVERHIESLGVGWTHLRPAAFMENTLSYAETIRSGGQFFAPLDGAAIAYVAAGDIARVAAEVLTHPEEHAGAAYDLTGPEPLGQATIADAITEATGRPVTYVSVAPEAAGEGMRTAGLPPESVDALLELFAVWRDGAAATVTDTVERLAGPPTTYAEWARAHAGAFR